jgi:hypothetical protein
MLLLAACTVTIVALTATSGGENDPYDRAEAAKFLTDLAANQNGMIAAGAVGVFSDALVALVVATMLFVLFRDRSSVLAPMMLVGVVAAAIISASNDVVGMLLTIVADDFVNGGPSGVAAGDPAALELGRFLGMVQFGMFLAINVAFGLALASLGTILSFSPQGAVNPPRWLGWVALISAAACWLSALVFVNEWLFVFFPVQLITSLLVFIGLGAWLVMRGERSSTLAATVTTQPSLAV